MTLPTVTAADVNDLATFAPDLTFVDAERRAVLLESAARDINAAPGSGKTTILAAKLLMLARKWPYERRGVCVLSHTNVARQQIQSRLACTVEGAQLLGYPHFIGTIHAFINQYLALPCLRSIDLAVDVIDDEIFAQRAVAMARKNYSLRGWMAKDESVESMVAGLVFRGSELETDTEFGRLPKPDSKTYPMLKEIKLELARKGIFRHADMFAFAECLLEKSPGMRDRLSTRFPLVFIDEMQDTSWAQEELLQRLFDDTTTIQRFGDINQRILGSDKDAEKLTFPTESALPISTSKRFGPVIASAVAGVQLSGKPVEGDRSDVHPPLLLVYSTEKVLEVIATFGREVLDRFDDDAIRAGDIKALCARKRGDAKANPGRSIADYWPAYAAEAKGLGTLSEQFWALLGDDTSKGRAMHTLAERATNIRKAIFLVLRAAGSTHAASVRDGSQLLRHLQLAGIDTSSIQMLCRDLAVNSGDTSSEDRRIAVLGLLFEALKPLLPADMTHQKFAELLAFDKPEAAPPERGERRICVVAHDGRQVAIQIGTVASMKGETHLATLVLESHGGQSKRFDLQEALMVLAGLSELPQQSKKLLSGQFRNLYVGMSRPTSFLCVAANTERVSDVCKKELQNRGWIVDSLT